MVILWKCPAADDPPPDTDLLLPRTTALSSIYPHPTLHLYIYIPLQLLPRVPAIDR